MSNSNRTNTDGLYKNQLHRRVDSDGMCMRPSFSRNQEFSKRGLSLCFHFKTGPNVLTTSIRKEQATVLGPRRISLVPPIYLSISFEFSMHLEFAILFPLPHLPSNTAALTIFRRIFIEPISLL